MATRKHITEDRNVKRESREEISGNMKEREEEREERMKGGGREGGSGNSNERKRERERDEQCSSAQDELEKDGKTTKRIKTVKKERR